MPTPPTFTKVNPADQPILYLVITSTTLPPWTLDEYAETRIAQRISHGQRRRAGAGARQPEVRRARAARSARAGGAADRHQRGRGGAARTGTSTRRPASIIGPHKAFTLQATGQLMNADAVPEHDRDLPQRRAGAARRARHDHRRRRGPADRVVVLHAATASSAPSRWASSASPAPTPSPSPTPSRRCCRSSAPSCRPASTWTCSTTARTRSASRTATSSSRWC